MASHAIFQCPPYVNILFEMDVFGPADTEYCAQNQQFWIDLSQRLVLEKDGVREFYFF